MGKDLNKASRDAIPINLTKVSYGCCSCCQS